MASDPFAQHQAILAESRKLLAALRRRPQITMDELIRIRARLGLLIREHRRTEEEVIYVPLFLSGAIDRVPRLKADLEHIKIEKGRYSALIQRWTPQAIQADWTGYTLAVAERVEQLAAMIRFEEEQIYRPVFALVTDDRNKRLAS